MEIIYSSESPGKEDRRWMFNTPCGGFLVAVRYGPLVIAVYHGPRFSITRIQYRSTVISPYNMRPEVEEVFIRKANLLYKDWKWRMNDHYEKTEEDGKNPYQLPFQDPRKIAGKKNRNAPVDVASRGHTLGSRSFAAAITIEANKPNGKVPDFCDRYKASHTLKDGGWIDPQYEEIQVRMVAMQDEASQSGCPLTDEELSRSNLGEAKYYVRGLGLARGPHPSLPNPAPTQHNKSCRKSNLRWSYFVRSDEENGRSMKGGGRRSETGVTRSKDNGKSSKGKEMSKGNVNLMSSKP